MGKRHALHVITSQEEVDPESLQDPVVTRLGTHRRRYHIRAAFQSVAFVCLVGFYSAASFYSSYSTRNNVQNGADITPHRRLQDMMMETETVDGGGVSSDCDDLSIAEPGWKATFHGIGVLYMFLALAIACDEFFVPALEEMSSPRRMNLSMDVAGATLMAAGGSAPELFTSLFGTFQETSIGFGTIVGSAVFNVLFVIAMCSLLANEVLNLTWWPLFRDSFFYAIGLVVLSIFVGVISANEIEWWEAVVLFIMYIGYTLFMWKNADVYKMLTGKELEYPDEDDSGDDDDDDDDLRKGDEKKPNGDDAPEAFTEEPSRDSSTPGGDAPKRRMSNRSALSNLSANDLRTSSMAQPHFRWQGTFRAGILKLLRDPDCWVETAGVGIVARIAGDADYVFSQVDIDGNGHVDREELKQLFNLLECYISPGELEEVFNQLDEDKDGTISQKEFTNWYLRSEERILSQVRHVFDTIDVNKSNTIDKGELKTLLAMLDPRVTDDDVEQAIDAMYKTGSRDEISFEEFSDWYKKSIIYERQKKAVEEDMEGVWENLIPPSDGQCSSWVNYLLVLPLVVVMTLTIPDVRRPGLGKWCYVAFFISICWIGFFAYLMVSWADTIGNTIGIPPVVMGLTVLAAGTSVPDLLSSVIVARRGSGDMAVSSSIGSNIFDILVGLPIPWLLYCLIPTEGKTEIPKVVEIGSDGIWISIFVLLGMLVFVIAAVHCQGWRLTKTLGGMMIVFYVLFLAQAIFFETPFEKCA